MKHWNGAAWKKWNMKRLQNEKSATWKEYNTKKQAKWKECNIKKCFLKNVNCHSETRKKCARIVHYSAPTDNGPSFDGPLYTGPTDQVHLHNLLQSEGIEPWRKMASTPSCTLPPKTYKSPLAFLLLRQNFPFLIFQVPHVWRGYQTWNSFLFFPEAR